MDGTDKDLGWEDVGMSIEGGTIPTGGITGVMGSGGAIGPIGSVPSDFAAGLPVDAFTGAMMNHFVKEARGGFSFMPGMMHSARRYFNVTHGYVCRKALWQIIPMPLPKKKDGELTGGEKDWTARIVDGLEANIEEPDLYIPTMSFITYVLLCGLIRGLKGKFEPEVLSATITFSIFILALEVLVVKVAFTVSGVANAPVVDIAALLGYKYFYLSLQIICGLLLGFGTKPQGFFYSLIALGLMASCAVALYMALRKLARMQPQAAQESTAEIHKMVVKALPILQVVICYMMLPSWPERPVHPAVAAHAAKVAAASASAIASTIAPAVAAAKAAGAAVAPALAAANATAKAAAAA